MRVSFVARRLSQMAPVLFGVSVVTWGLTSLAPGDSAEIYARQYAENGRPTVEEIARARRSLHLDGSRPEQYLHWLGRAVRGDLGHSFSSGRLVTHEIGARLPATLQLAFAAIVFVVAFGITFGVAAALSHRRLGDTVLRFAAVGGGAVPSFWLALLLIWLFAAHWHLLPSFGRGDGAINTHLVLPVVSLGLVHVGAVARLTRSTMVDALNQEYVRGARARGLREHRVIVAHALRNALLPVVTQAGLTFGGMLGGAAVVETIFAWPGIGKLATDSIAAKDYPLLQGTVLVAALAYLLVGLALDLLYGRLDPRISRRAGQAE